MPTSSFKNGLYKASVLAFLLAFIAGCELLPLAASPIIVSGAGGGVAYTVTNVAYKTMIYPISKVESSLHRALKKMGIKEVKREVTKDTVTIKAVTKKLDITIDLEKVTEKTTRMKVNAKQDYILKDKATATEIIVQTEKDLEEEGKKPHPPLSLLSFVHVGGEGGGKRGE